MTTYNTYAEAKIDNKDKDIYELDGRFQAVDNAPTSHFANGWSKCNPADHCMSVVDFIAAGHSFEFGDVYLSEKGYVTKVGTNIAKNSIYYPNVLIKQCFVLSAKALEDLEVVKHKESTAVKTLENLDYQYKSGEFWEPPVKDLRQEIEQVEWDGEGLPPVGLMCQVSYVNSKDEWTVFVPAKVKAKDESKVWFSFDKYDLLKSHEEVRFRKIETPEQKKEREIGLSLMNTLKNAFPHVNNFSEDLDKWARVAKDIGYQKSE